MMYRMIFQYVQFKKLQKDFNNNLSTKIMSTSPYSQLPENRMNYLSPAVSSQSIEYSFQTATFGTSSGNCNYLEIPNSNSANKNQQQNSAKALRQDSLQSLFEELVNTQLRNNYEIQQEAKQNYCERFFSQAVVNQSKKTDEQIYWKSLLINRLKYFQKQIKDMKNTIEKLKLYIQVQEFQKKYSLKKIELALQIYSDSLAKEKQVNEQLEKKIKVLENQSQNLKENLSETNKKLMSTILMNSSLTIKVEQLNSNKNKKSKIDSEEENSDFYSSNCYHQNNKELFSQKHADTPKLLTHSKTLSSSQSQHFKQAKSENLKKKVLNKKIRLKFLYNRESGGSLALYKSNRLNTESVKTDQE